MNIRNKHYLIFTTILVSIVAISCKKETITTPPVYNIPGLDTLNVPQYGTPFNNVPDAADIIMYQVNMRAFSKQGTLGGVIPRLDSIKALGANVIYLMPFHPVGITKSINSPYGVTDHTVVGEEYGDINQLRALVDAAHSKGMAVIMDWLANYTAWDHKWIKTHPNWYLRRGDTITHPLTQNWYDVAALALDSPQVRIAEASIMKYWVKKANIDGFRCDYADNPSEGFWKQMIDTLNTIKTHKLILFAEGGKTHLYKSGFEMIFGFRFFEKLNNIYKKKEPLQSLDYVNREDYRQSVDDQWVIRYTTNHDINDSHGTPQELFGGLDGSIGAFLIAAYMKGVPMIYNGQEIGLDYKIEFPFTKQDIDWTPKHQVTNLYKKIIALRKSSDAIKRGTLTNYSDVNTCCFAKEKGSEKVITIVNTRNIATGFTIPAALENTTWTDVLNGGTVKLNSSIALKANGYLVLKN